MMTDAPATNRAQTATPAHNTPAMIYAGTLVHRRQAAPVHSFSYRMRLLWLDLDQLDTQIDRHPFWSSRRPALAWLRRGDYLRPEIGDLKTAVLDTLQERLGFRPEGRVQMLTAPRVFGIGFNPLTLYYAHDAQDQLCAVLAEVRNTPWLERQLYALDLRNGEHPPAHAKTFHVSPFLPMDLSYHWWLPAPDDLLRVSLSNRRGTASVFRAGLYAEQQTFSPLKELFLHWPQGLKTLCGIYWQALKLLIRGARFHSHPGRASAQHLHSPEHSAAHSAGEKAAITEVTP